MPHNFVIKLKLMLNSPIATSKQNSIKCIGKKLGQNENLCKIEKLFFLLRIKNAKLS